MIVTLAVCIGLSIALASTLFVWAMHIKPAPCDYESPDAAYKRGYDTGFAEGRREGAIEGVIQMGLTTQSRAIHRMIRERRIK